MFVPILTYHKIQPKFSVASVTPKQFDRQMALLASMGYRSMSLEEYLAGSGDEGKRVVITFDDAYASVYDTAYPILRRYGFTATVFVITAFVGKWNTWDFPFTEQRIRHCDWPALSALRDAGWEIGSHTVTHPDLCSLSQDAVQVELQASREELQDKLQCPVNVLAYPYGRFCSTVIDAAKEAGYRAACTLGQNYPHSQKIPYAIFRRGVYSFDPMPLFKAKLTTGRLSYFDDIKQKCLTFCAKGSILLRQIKN